jgi:enoyl-[acyl-carrier protein] reductase I
MGGKAQLPTRPCPAAILLFTVLDPVRPAGGTKPSMIDLKGKTAVVFGLANKRSIAWGVAQKLHQAGATLAICYKNDRMKQEAQSLIDDLPGATGFQCDVSVDAEIDTLFGALQAKYTKLDILVHAVA